MKNNSFILTVGLALVATAGAAHAAGPETRAGTPEIIAAVNAGAHQVLGDEEMARIVGTAVQPGRYTVDGTLPNGMSYTGTATISAQGDVYLVKWDVSGKNQSATGPTAASGSYSADYVGRGIDQGTVFAVAYESGSRAMISSSATSTGSGTLLERLQRDGILGSASAGLPILTVYTINPDGSLTGRVVASGATTLGTETLLPLP